MYDLVRQMTEQLAEGVEIPCLVQSKIWRSIKKHLGAVKWLQTLHCPFLSQDIVDPVRAARAHFSILYVPVSEIQE